MSPYNQRDNGELPKAFIEEMLYSDLELAYRYLKHYNIVTLDAIADLAQKLDMDAVLVSKVRIEGGVYLEPVYVEIGFAVKRGQLKLPGYTTL